jgi:hypothetical protein
MRFLPLALLGLTAVAGCTSKDTVGREAAVPKYDPDGIAKAAIADYDKNGDGLLDVNELKACPALYWSLAAIDTNGDKKLSADEIRKRVESYAAGPTGSVPVTCTVRLDGQPFGGATVTFDPEPCMGKAIKHATATTDAEGRCVEYQVEGKTYRGLSAGLYRIRVTKDGVSIPLRFNTESAIGQEVFHDTRAALLPIDIDIVSK